VVGRYNYRYAVIAFIRSDERIHGVAVVIPTNHREIPGSTPERYDLQIKITSLSKEGRVFIREFRALSSDYRAFLERMLGFSTECRLFWLSIRFFLRDCRALLRECKDLLIEYKDFLERMLGSFERMQRRSCACLSGFFVQNQRLFRALC